ncbi:MAG TPA: hypothetical protein VK469_11865, partial [Candidatus Kapabacteria bacterium]|nr:hypothetical protein [Candidatus Kapabacteria bacterium]
INQMRGVGRWLLTGMASIPAEKRQAYEELFVLLEVPEVGRMIKFQLKIAKVIFKDEIKEAGVPQRIK